ncbi:MAG TPA: peptide chain release factor-like protein, partial [Pyrinomonadaceae bacterium]|nr:peptide chain release factor-like protein [Pyrinomonadaceae bacterium]
GGQHVNKTETAVRLKHTRTGIVVVSREMRSQRANKNICLRKLRERVAQMNHRPAKRVPTRVPKSAKNRTLEAKARRARVKRLRAKPSADD